MQQVALSVTVPRGGYGVKMTELVPGNFSFPFPLYPPFPGTSPRFVGP